MAYDVSTRAGGWVAAQAGRRRRRGAVAATVVVLTAAFLLAAALGGFAHPLVVLVGTGVAVGAYRAADRALDDAVRWHRGAEAERAVGDLLAALGPTFTVLHDLDQAGEGNVDHLVSGPTGVFMVETKARRYEQLHLLKARRQAAKLHDELGVWVTPVICIHERRGREPFRDEGVWVVTSERLVAWIAAQRNATLPFERLARFADAR